MSKRKRDFRVVTFLLGLSVALAPPAGLAGDTGSRANRELSAAEKLEAVIEAAWATGPDLAESLAWVNAEASADRSLRGPGTPYVEFQIEGIGPSFENQPNAMRYLRLGTPFDMPWQFTSSRRLGKSLDNWESLAAQAARVQVAEIVAGFWLQLAAVEERIQVEERRLNRMDQSVKLQTERFNLGEVAGMEVMQLELQRARDASTLRALQALRHGVEAQVQRLAGDNVPLPSVGDLQELADHESSSADESDIEKKVGNGILYSSLFTRAEKQQLLSDLVGSTAWGRPEVQIEWEHVPSFDVLQSFNAFGFTISVPLPLGKLGGQQKAAARAEAEAAAAALERGRRALVQRAKAALAAARSSAQRLEETESVLDRLPRAETSLSEQFRLGAISYLVFIDGLARLDDLLLHRIESYETLLLARMELAAILGDSNLFPFPQTVFQFTREAK